MARRRGRQQPRFPTFGTDSFFSQSGMNQYGRDPASGVVINTNVDLLQANQADALFRDWACKKVVALRPKRQRQGGASIDSRVLEPTLISQLNNWIKTRLLMYEEAQVVANLHGNAAFFLIIDDNKPPWEPVDTQNIKSIEIKRPYDRWEFTLNWQGSMEVESYTPHIVTNRTLLQGAVNWHPERVFLFRGDELPHGTKQRLGGYDDSVLIKFIEPLKRHLLGNAHAAAALATFEQIVFKLPQMTHKMSEDPQKVFTWFNSMRQIASSMGWLVLDKDWESNILSRSFTGVEAILEQCRQEMIAASGLTRVELYQEFPSGLQATGQAERMEAAARYRGAAEDEWGELLKRDVQLFLWMNKIDVNPLDWSITWNSSFEETPLERAKKEETYARSDSLNIASNIYTGIEARSRYSGDVFNPTITLDTEMGEEMEDEEMETGKSEDSSEKVTVSGEVLPESEYEKVIEEEEIEDAFER